MKTSYLMPLVALLFATFGAHAQPEAEFFATERYTLNYNDVEFQGQNRMLPLKQALNRAYPDLDLRDARLMNIMVRAKSRMGRGTVSFISGGRVVATQNIEGTRNNFEDDNLNSYDRIDFGRMPMIRDGATWQLRFSGNIKLKRVVLTIDGARDNDNDRFGNFTFVSLGSARADKIVPSTDTFRVGAGRGDAEVLLIRARDGDVTIDEVIVRFTDGRAQRVSSLTGTIREGQQAIAYMNNGDWDRRQIMSVSVRTHSRNLFGSRATYEVLAGIRRGR